MRTTIDLPDDLHAIATSIARDQGITLSAAVALLLCKAVGHDKPGPTQRRCEKTGILVFHLGRPITTEDVRALEDEE